MQVAPISINSQYQSKNVNDKYFVGRQEFLNREISFKGLEKVATANVIKTGSKNTEKLKYALVSTLAFFGIKSAKDKKNKILSEKANEEMSKVSLLHEKAIEEMKSFSNNVSLSLLKDEYLTPSRLFEPYNKRRTVPQRPNLPVNWGKVADEGYSKIYSGEIDDTITILKPDRVDVIEPNGDRQIVVFEDDGTINIARANRQKGFFECEMIDHNGRLLKRARHVVATPVRGFDVPEFNDMVRNANTNRMLDYVYNIPTGKQTVVFHEFMYKTDQYALSTRGIYKKWFKVLDKELKYCLEQQIQDVKIEEFAPFCYTKRFYDKNGVEVCKSTEEQVEYQSKNSRFIVDRKTGDVIYAKANYHDKLGNSLIAEVEKGMGGKGIEKIFRWNGYYTPEPGSWFTPLSTPIPIPSYPSVPTHEKNEINKKNKENFKRTDVNEADIIANVRFNGAKNPLHRPYIEKAKELEVTVVEPNPNYHRQANAYNPDCGPTPSKQIHKVESGTDGTHKHHSSKHFPLAVYCSL